MTFDILLHVVDIFFGSSHTLTTAPTPLATMTTQSEEEQQLTAVEEGDGLLRSTTTTSNQLVQVWNCGFGLFCVATLFLIFLACFQFFFETTVVYDVHAKWRPVVDILNASKLEELKYTHNVGDYEIQGLAMNSDSSLLYEFHTLGVRVLELNITTGSVVKLLDTRVYTSNDFPMIYDQQVAHVGVIDYTVSETHGDELWIGTHSDGIHGEGALVAVDPISLDIKRDRMVRTRFNLDWVAYKDGILYFGTFFNVKTIQRVHLDSLEFLHELQLNLPSHLEDSGINYVQSAAFDLNGRLVLLGDDYQCTIYVLDAQTGDFDTSQALLLGSQTDGLTFNTATNSMLVGLNRQHSHEQVMGQAPMVSVIELQLF